MKESSRPRMTRALWWPHHNNNGAFANNGGGNRIIKDVVLLHYCVHIHLPASRTTRVLMQGRVLLPWVDILLQDHFRCREIGV